MKALIVFACPHDEARRGSAAERLLNLSDAVDDVVTTSSTASKFVLRRPSRMFSGVVSEVGQAPPSKGGKKRVMVTSGMVGVGPYGGRQKDTLRGQTG